MQKFKILFISHTYPPIVGGIEAQNFELAKWLGKIAQVKVIANTKGRWFLPIFAPLALMQALWLLPKYDVVIFGSGILAIDGWIIKLFSKKPVISVIHGLDINYGSASLGVRGEKILVTTYQKLWVGIFLKSADKLIAVGNETIKVAVERGIPKEKIVFIPNGVDTEKNLVEKTKTDLEKILGISIAGKKILLTSGRLAKRKGVVWFIRNVFPKLPTEYLYVIAGDGKDKESALQAITEQGLQQRVLMLGYITDEVRNMLWATCDLFVQPNIKIAGDMEGFGISVIEAGACRLPVLASNLEGLKDAIKDGKNGFLVESENSQAFAEKITQLFANGSPREIFGKATRDYVVENYQWKKIAQHYLAEIEKVISNQ
ncbi:MAG: glycosyltransferase family 4 protein [Candidatus Moraniibacteriota bacterium]